LGMYEVSREHRQYFALIFLDRSVPRISREYERFAFARERKARIVQGIQACIDAGELPTSVDPVVATRMLMVGIVGVAALRLSDRLAPGEDADLLALDVINLTIAGLKSGVILQSRAVECPLDQRAIDAQAS